VRRAGSRLAFFGVLAVLGAAGVAATLAWHASMPAMGVVPMPGGWRMSMPWMRMCGQTWGRAAASFVGMWIAMMVPMMLPSLAPILWRYHQALGGAGQRRPGRLTALAGAGYFFVWTAVGIVAFALGAALGGIAMQVTALARAVPIAAGVIVVMAGGLQFTAWKARQLACCRQAWGCAHALPADAGSAWRYGLRLGLHCIRCCAGLTAVLLVMGVMDLRVMAAVTVGMTLERLVPAGRGAAWLVGAAVAGAGLAMLLGAGTW
jgi:predicted metal-binding membrane protein